MKHITTYIYLMMKWFRRLSKIYVLITKPVAALQRNKTYLTGSANVYEAYQDKNKKPMKAPFMLAELDKETKLLKLIVENIDDDIAGHIRFVDPLANHPNLIQSIDLLGIHEQHHFLLCNKYYQLSS
ncbi:hypothetical protein GCM10008924_30250 [Gracilibacillus halotolerans]|uniref:hypothetical protein n=1 Tax=Gracilibacillus halotolerans TaxID=74386 RepID=UPI001FE75641|nr:hypothetical protein [Gracilibacillus halotolerans]